MFLDWLILVQLISNSSAKFCNNSAKIWNKLIWLVQPISLKQSWSNGYRLLQNKTNMGATLYEVKFEFGLLLFTMAFTFFKMERLTQLSDISKPLAMYNVIITKQENFVTARFTINKLKLQFSQKMLCIFIKTQ
jgi:hypothetical protein